MNKKILTIAILGILVFSMVGVLAQQNGIGVISPQEKEQRQNQFENNYQYQNLCDNAECQYQTGETLTLQIREQKRFLFMNVEMKSEYDIDSEGNIERARYNLWSRLLGQERIQ